MRLLLALPLLMASACCPPGPGYRTSSVADAVFTAAQVAATHPEIVVPRSNKKQAEMEQDADDRLGQNVLPESLLGPDTFLYQD